MEFASDESGTFVQTNARMWGRRVHQSLCISFILLFAVSLWFRGFFASVSVWPWNTINHDALTGQRPLPGGKMEIGLCAADQSPLLVHTSHAPTRPHNKGPVRDIINSDQPVSPSSQRQLHITAQAISRPPDTGNFTISQHWQFHTTTQAVTIS